jgi:hypothetical protein
MLKFLLNLILKMLTIKFASVRVINGKLLLGPVIVILSTL